MWKCFFQDKFLEEEETGNFFGFNFNSTVARDAGILTALTGSLNYLYDNVIDSYVENVYTLVVQEYTIATIKVKNDKFKRTNANFPYKTKPNIEVSATKTRTTM